MQVCLDMQSDIQISEPVVTPQGIGGKCDIILMLNWTKRSFNSDLRKSFWKDYAVNQHELSHVKCFQSLDDIMWKTEYTLWFNSLLNHLKQE